MALDRRDFLKIAGLSTILGLGGKAAFELLTPGEIEASTNAPPLSKGKRWAMVVDSRKMDEALLDKCIDACHSEHNVPDIGTAKEEIKWVWKEDYHHSFPGQHHEYIGDEVTQELSFDV